MSRKDEEVNMDMPITHETTGSVSCLYKHKARIHRSAE
jgi:hypothetical protein